MKDSKHQDHADSGQHQDSIGPPSTKEVLGRVAPETWEKVGVDPKSLAGLDLFALHLFFHEVGLRGEIEGIAGFPGHDLPSARRSHVDWHADQTNVGSPHYDSGFPHADYRDPHLDYHSDSRGTDPVPPHPNHVDDHADKGRHWDDHGDHTDEANPRHVDLPKSHSDHTDQTHREFHCDWHDDHTDHVDHDDITSST